MNYAMNWGPMNPQPNTTMGFMDVLQNQDINLMDWLNPQQGLDSVLAPVTPGATPAANAVDGKDFWLGNAKKGTNGALMPAIYGVNALVNGWMGLEKLEIAKDQLKENQRQFNLNFGSQAKLTNSRLADRQDRRVAEGRANLSTNEYLSKYGVKA